MVSFLADKSALARQETRPEVREIVEPLLLAGEIATCGIVELELLFSATGRDTYRALAKALLGMLKVEFDQPFFDLALEVQAHLAVLFHHRAVPLPDLLVAASAERADLVVLHYDADFERIAELTGQAEQWVVPRGTVS